MICALYDKSATGMFTGLTIKDIQEQEICEGLSQSIIYRILTDLYNKGYVRVGAKVRNAYTYFLTVEGIELYLSETGGGNNEG